MTTKLKTQIEEVEKDYRLFWKREDKLLLGDALDEAKALIDRLYETLQEIKKVATK